MRKRKPINYEIHVTGEPVIARLPKEQADSLVFSLELIIYDMLHDEQKKALLFVFRHGFGYQKKPFSSRAENIAENTKQSVSVRNIFRLFLDASVFSRFLLCVERQKRQRRNMRKCKKFLQSRKQFASSVSTILQKKIKEALYT